MKKKIFVLICMILFFVAGCGAKTELDKFKHYLVKKEKFKCKQHECTKKVKFNVPGDISMVLEFDFENNTMMDAVYGNNGLTTTEIIYNWSLKTGAYYSYTLGIKIDATYDYLNDEYNCTSDYSDKEYVNLECDGAILELKRLKNDFEEMMISSGVKSTAK